MAKRIKNSMRATVKDKAKQGEFDLNMLKKKYRQYVNTQVFNGEDYLSFDEWVKQQDSSE